MDISTLTFEQLTKQFRLMNTRHTRSTFIDAPYYNGERVDATGCSQFEATLGQREVSIEIQWKLSYEPSTSYADVELDIDSQSSVVIRGLSLNRIEDNLYMCRFEASDITHGASPALNRKLSLLVEHLPVSTYALILFLEHQDSQDMIAA